MPKFYKKNEFNYNKPKFSNNYKKRGGPVVNVRGFEEFRESNSPFKWMKVTCLTHSENDVHDIIDQIKKLHFKNSGDNIPMTAYNVLCSKGTLEFYIKLRKYDIDYLIRNIYKIDHHRLKCYKSEDVHVPHEMPSKWIDIVKQTLQNRYIMNSQTNESELNLSSFQDDPVLLNNGLMMKFSSPRVLEAILNILKEELNELTKLDLSKNNISSIYKLKAFVSKVKVTQLDLSNNNISNINELNVLHPSSIVNLNVKDNQFRKFSSQELKKQVRNILPQLRFLNGMQMEDSVIIAGTVSKPLPESIPCNRDTEAFKFVMEFLSKFDCEKRDKLSNYYNSESRASLATYGDSHAFYKEHNSKILNVDADHRSSNNKIGLAKIMGLFADFPPTKHIESSINVDVISSSEQCLILKVIGVFVELATSRSAGCRVREFARDMVIVPGGILLNDHIQLMPNNSQLFHQYRSYVNHAREIIDFGKSYRDLSDLLFQELEIVKQFKDFSRMNVSVCLQFLKNFGNVETATEEFIKLQSEGAVPAHAFEEDGKL